MRQTFDFFSIHHNRVYTTKYLVVICLTLAITCTSSMTVKSLLLFKVNRKSLLFGKAPPV